MLGLVADLEPGDALALVEGTLGGLRPGLDEPVPAPFHAHAQAHEPHPDGEQTHLSLTAPGVGPRDAHWLAWQVALTALSGGSASRLFHAVREERGLAYAVSASPILLGGHGYLSAYAASTPDRAPRPFRSSARNSPASHRPHPAEFERARTGLATSVIFGAESLRGRAHALTRDVALFGRPAPSRPSARASRP